MRVVYMVECADTSLYVGITHNFEHAHATGKGAKYTKSCGLITLRYTETMDSKGSALRREAAIKALDRSAKLALISTDDG